MRRVIVLTGAAALFLAWPTTTISASDITPVLASSPAVVQPESVVVPPRQPATTGNTYDIIKIEGPPIAPPKPPGKCPCVPPSTPKAQPPKAQPAAVTLRPTPGGQADIDRCKLVLWSPNLIAGHQTCGGKRPWDFLDNIPVGTVVQVVGTSAAGTYVVYGHKWQAGKGGPVPGWMPSVPLVLQTCTTSGTGFSLLRRR